MMVSEEILKSALTTTVAAMRNWQVVNGFEAEIKNFGEGMVAYCGPGDTVTSFYLIVGERWELC